MPIDLHDLRHYDQDLAADLLDRPLDFVLPFQEVLSEVIQTMMDPTEFQKEVNRLQKQPKKKSKRTQLSLLPDVSDKTGKKK